MSPVTQNPAGKGAGIRVTARVDGSTEALRQRPPRRMDKRLGDTIMGATGHPTSEERDW